MQTRLMTVILGLGACMGFLWAVTPIEVDMKTTQYHNPTAYISSQCYTKTEGDAGSTHNPCFTCHRKAVEPNYTFDWFLQEELRFPEEATVNRFTNLFKDRRDDIANISDRTILDYVRTDNYQSGKHVIALREKLKNLPNEWDFDNDGRWGGYTPDCYFSFDKDGFDHAPDGSMTGWRAFAYYPFLGTFWPTNGSTDDVLIRLPAHFRQDSARNENREIYKLNLAIIESLIKREDVLLGFTVDETRYGVDLNRDGALGKTDVVTFGWYPERGEWMSYVGLAKELLEQKKIHLAAGLYPVGVEFLHSVRYIDLDDRGGVRMAARMKELRYAKKHYWMSYARLQLRDDKKDIEKLDWPDRIELFHGDFERGMATGTGWAYQGFIEDAKGELRPQSNEETLFCMGCHSNIAATADSTFVFQRKVPGDSYRGGWYHWTQRGLEKMQEPRRKDRKFEFTHYLRHNGAGDEFRANDEIREKFFDAKGQLKPEAVRKMRNDVTYLLNPSPERALQLNKAYRVLVMEQSYIHGRDAVAAPAQNVHKEVEQDALTGLKAIDKIYGVFSR